ncbi:MAG: MurR/RpiR family transcriptional regulator [Gammaproteobacteria bacterium]
MKQSLFERLEKDLERFTPAERQVASFILTNRASIPFETAASLARKLNVSAVTVGRFCRMLGYRHFRGLKEDLRTSVSDAPWLVGSRFTDFLERSSDQETLKHGLEKELASIVRTYDLLATPTWKSVVSLLANSETVHIAGFQTERGAAVLFANHLQYVRDNVELVDLSSGHYADIFIRRGKSRCLVLMDMRRYSSQSVLVAQKAHALKIPLLVITDEYCDWARRYTPHVLIVSSDFGQFWASLSAMTCLFALLINAVAARLGPSVEKRLEAISESFEHFTGFHGRAPSARRSNRSSRKPGAE